VGGSGGTSPDSGVAGSGASGGAAGGAPRDGGTSDSGTSSGGASGCNAECSIGSRRSSTSPALLLFGVALTLGLARRKSH
jgi:hypothetical protein